MSPKSTCGHCADGSGPKPTFRVEFQGEGKPRPDHCGTCGRQLVFRLEFDKAG